jgi:hypothetical protein
VVSPLPALFEVISNFIPDHSGHVLSNLSTVYNCDVKYAADINTDALVQEIPTKAVQI